MKRLASKLLASVAIAAQVWGFAAGHAAEAPQVKKSQSVTLGIISEINRAQVADHFSDFARYVAAQLAPDSDIEGKVMIAPTPFQLARLIEQKKVDFYMDSPYPTYLVNDVHDVARLLLRRWKGGLAEYRSLIFTKKNGEITRLEDLRGKLFAFEDPESTSGHFLPKFFLKQKGFKFADKSRFNPNAAPTDIGYIFAYSQRSLLEWVFSKKAAAGAFSDDDFARLEGSQKADIAILAQTQPLPRHFISVRKDFSPALTDRLEKVLLAMNESEDGRKILKKTDDTTKFDRLPEGEAGLRRRLAEIFKSEKN